ncbi:MAG: OmpA family protein [Ignavibacteriae bacterium]|nr:OmpA family protein [Ignavibacteriota bacterium]
MTKYFTLLSVFFLLTTIPLIAQIEKSGLSAGLDYGGIYGSTEFEEELRFQGRTFLRYGLSPQFHLELGGGMGRISGSEFSTFLMPIDARLLVHPLDFERWYPYAYAGYGTTRYVVDEVPNNADKNRKTDGWAGNLPFGVGLVYYITDNVAFDANVGYNLTSTDNFDVTETDSKNDNYLGFLLGLMTTIESGSADADGDGLTNDQEKELGTDKRNPDTDGDGLKDGEEVNNYQTDPKKADTDNDILSDADEAKKYSTNPNKADSDEDGLNDADEISKHNTEPTKADTDGDGLNDGDELNKHKTNPKKADSDADGLSDNDELSKHNTNPLVADSDNGTVNDGTEVGRGTNPLEAKDDIPKETIKIEKGQNLVLEGIIFQTASADISPESEKALEKAYNTFMENPELEVEIQGHTDNVGSRTKNMKLSEERAESVKAYLVNKGISANRITTKGFGSKNPIADNKTDEGRQKNRRIEFFRTK